MLVAPETLSDLKLAEGARAQANGGALLPPLRVQPQSGARRAGRRHRHRAEPAEDAGSALAASDRQDDGQTRAAGKHRRRPASADRTRCGDRPRTPHRQLSPEPDRVRTAVVLCRAVHRQFGDRAGLRAAAAGAAHLARLRRLGADAQRRAGARTGVAGAGRRADRSRVRLLHRRRAAARCRGLAARALWRADSGTADAQAAMVDRRHRHQHCWARSRPPPPA